MTENNYYLSNHPLNKIIYELPREKWVEGLYNLCDPGSLKVIQRNARNGYIECSINGSEEYFEFSPQELDPNYRALFDKYDFILDNNSGQIWLVSQIPILDNRNPISKYLNDYINFGNYYELLQRSESKNLMYMWEGCIDESTYTKLDLNDSRITDHMRSFRNKFMTNPDLYKNEGWILTYENATWI